MLSQQPRAIWSTANNTTGRRNICSLGIWFPRQMLDPSCCHWTLCTFCGQSLPFRGSGSVLWTRRREESFPPSPTSSEVYFFILFFLLIDKWLDVFLLDACCNVGLQTDCLQTDTWTDRIYLHFPLCSVYCNIPPVLNKGAFQPKSSQFTLFLQFGWSHQGSTRPIICLHLTLSSASSSLTPTNSMSSFTTSINHLFALPLISLPL